MSEKKPLPWKKILILVSLHVLFVVLSLGCFGIVDYFVAAGMKQAMSGFLMIMVGWGVALFFAALMLPLLLFIEWW